MKAIFTFILVLFPNIYAPAQTGCTDPQALNFDFSATENDGSCLYPLTEYSPMQIAVLPDELKECSGAEWFGSALWVHNDGGNENKIYRIDPLNGNIIQTVTIANALNVDWEDFAESETHLFIGDFGNNAGNRTDLKIFRIDKNDLTNDTAFAEVIGFEYPDQTDFSENTNNHNFDCEAFLYYNDQLHLFSKNWVDHQTKHYTLPAEPGSYAAQLQGAFNVDGLITAADISDDKELVLLGYTPFGFNFMWLLFDFDEDQFFSGNKRRISLGTGLTNSQTEAITFTGNGSGIIGSEQFIVNSQLVLPQKMLSFSISQWVSSTSPATEVSPLDKIYIYPNPSNGFCELENTGRESLSWKLYNEAGREMRKGTTTNQLTHIKTTGLPPGVYYLVVSRGKFQKSFALVVK